MNAASTTVKPNDISNILFQKKTDPVVSIEPYVGPVEISCDGNKVSHGRGLIATRDIEAGELLFLTPPTVEAPLEKVYELWQDRHSSLTDGDRCLEECAEHVLLDAMQEACTNQPAVAASFLALVGSPLVDMQATTAPSITILLGQGNGDSIIDATAVTRDDCLKIVRANAFGPDGLHSYEYVEQQWWQHAQRKANDSKATALLQTTRLLGMYPLADMVNHSCNANAVRVYARNLMMVHALTTIQSGTEIVMSYVPPTQPQRRPVLENQHGFVCACTRCQIEDDVQLETEEWQSWNHPHLAKFPSYPTLHKAIRHLEDDILTDPKFSNEVRRYLRISYLHVYIHYLNAALHILLTEDDALVANILRTDLLTLCTQLHFSFCACHNAATEHLSILHLCYELASILHTHASDPTKNLPKVRFWTEQLKKAHMLRYGSLGQSVDNLRRAMQHSRKVLRQKNGWESGDYCFV
eukprot:scaffold1267_cov171-Amphora_coffeaeformis.AAC.19